MNPRQRRGLVYMLIGLVVAVSTFVVVTRYVANVNSQVGSRITVYRARASIPAYTPLTAQNLEAVEVPRRWASESAIVPMEALLGRRVGFELKPGTTVATDMLIPPSNLNPNEREVAINVNSVTGVAGRVRPGDRVDLYAVFAEVPGLPKSVRVLTRNVRVVSISGQLTVSKQGNGAVSEQNVIPVTLALVPNDAQAVAYASAFASEVRLVALPTDVGTDRRGEKSTYDASNLGGRAIPEGTK